MDTSFQQFEIACLITIFNKTHYNVSSPTVHSVDTTHKVLPFKPKQCLFDGPSDMMEQKKLHIEKYCTYFEHRILIIFQRRPHNKLFTFRSSIFRVNLLIDIENKKQK